jgi:hypothetical protein
MFSMHFEAAPTFEGEAFDSSATQSTIRLVRRGSRS